MARPRTTRRTSVRLAGLAMWALYVPVALLGALVMTPTVLLTVAPTVALAAVALLAVLHRTSGRPGPDRPAATSTAAAAALVVPFHEGVELLEDAGAVIAMAVLGLLAHVGNHWWTTTLDADRAGSATAVVARSLRSRLRRMPLEDVLHEWRALESGAGFASDARHTAAAAQVRSLVLDELEHRDPVGFRQWLADGAVDPPELHVRADRGLHA